MTDKHLLIDEGNAFYVHDDIEANSLLLEIHYQSCGISGVVYGKYIRAPGKGRFMDGDMKLGSYDKTGISDFFVDNDHNIYLDDIEAYLRTFSPSTEIYKLRAGEHGFLKQKNWELFMPKLRSDITQADEKEGLIQLAHGDGIILAQKLAIQFGLQIDARSGVNLLAAICLKMMSINELTALTLLHGVWNEAQSKELVYQAESDVSYYSDRITFLEYRVVNEMLM
ncbi:MULTISPECIES: PALP domain-containing protein [Olivibacter]|uniref:Uncharacterized protein n=1 Tax=Olivibacter jilunii TaxID=985016 RepID=A0ABW6B7X3_9SPHI|nr:hypothetical protein [Olivibacter sp. UJ_SKK_5.1]MDX3912824.1 hypothetical protein [Pseudosphingobacterium sp.]